MKNTEKNIELLKQAVETDAVIRPIAKHRKPDGSLDIEGNLLLWNKALEPFEKTRLWEQGTPCLLYTSRKQPEKNGSSLFQVLNWMTSWMKFWKRQKPCTPSMSQEFMQPAFLMAVS